VQAPARFPASRQLLALAILVALGAGWMLLAQRLVEAPFDLGLTSALGLAAVLVLASGWAGWAVRQAWMYPPLLQKAEVLWAENGRPEDVEAILSGAVLARGELGFRVGTLRGHALLAQGRRDLAWLAYLQAELARLPFLARILVAPLFQVQDEENRPWRLRRARWMLHVAPRMARLRHLLAVLHLRDPDSGAHARAWTLLEESLTLGAEDPLLLEDALLTGLRRDLPELRDKALALLMARHMDPRLRWERAGVAAALNAAGRSVEALLLARSVPAEMRSGPDLWAVEAQACRSLGDMDAADRAVEDGLKRFPSDFRLWMESHALALEDRAFDDALDDLEQAGKAADPEDPSQAWEVTLRRAEFAWWVDGDATAAREHLSKVPQEHRGDRIPPLELHLQVALGECQTAFPAIQALLASHPQNVGVMLLHGECLAGLDAWDTLLDFLNSRGEILGEEASYWHLRGLCLAHSDKALEARDNLERAARMDPGALRFVLDAAHACAELGEWERSESHWRQALHLEVSCEEALIHLAEARLALHDQAGAIRCLRECLLHHPESQEGQLRLAELEAQ
jgi:tetratricopeptide (TPR) repeat protein